MLVAPPCGSSVRRESQGSGGLIDVLDEKLEKSRVLETAEPPKVVAEADLEMKMRSSKGTLATWLCIYKNTVRINTHPLHKGVNES